MSVLLLFLAISIFASLSPRPTIDPVTKLSSNE